MVEYMLGKREAISVCEEQGGYADLGTNTMADNGFMFGVNQRIEPNFSKSWQEIINSGADSREIEGLEVGPEDLKFTLVFHPTNWKFLKYCAHGSVTNTDDITYYTHTFTKKDDVTSFTTEWAKRSGTNHVITLTGCVIKNLVISFTSGTGPTEGFIEVRAECVAKSLATGTSVTSVSVPTEKVFQFRMAKLTWDNLEVTEVNNGELTIDNGINEEDSRYANATLDQAIGEPIPKTLRYNYRFNINQKDDTYFDDWNGETAISNCKLEFIRGTSDQCSFSFTNNYVDSATSPTNMEGITNVDLVGKPLGLTVVAKDGLNDY